MLIAPQTNSPALTKAVGRRDFRLESGFAWQYSKLYITVRCLTGKQLMRVFGAPWLKYGLSGRLAYCNTMVLRINTH